MCFGCSKEPSHRDGSLEYLQHMFWLRNKKNYFQLHTLIWGPECLKHSFSLLFFLQDSDLSQASIFTGEEELFAFERTVSRLAEMQSEEYWNHRHFMKQS